MKIVLNSSGGMPRLKEGLEAAGHEVLEDIWGAERIVALKVDVVFFGIQAIFRRKWHFISLALKLRRAGVPIVTWNVDSPWNMGRSTIKVNCLLRSGLINVYATHSLQKTDQLDNLRVLYLPNAAWLSQYNLAGKSIEEFRDDSRYKWDVSFVGNLDADNYREHRARVQFLTRLAAILDTSGIRYRFIDGKAMSIAEQVDFIQQSRINLSCVSAADSSRHGASWGLTERSYGVPACGGFLLMEERLHLRNDFAVDEVATYRSLDHCAWQIRYYLNNLDERRRIAEKAYLRVMKDHTYQQRAISLMAEVESCLKSCQ